MSSAYIGVKEVRGRVPGTTCNGARNAVNNSQASGYVKEPEKVAQCLGYWRHRTKYRGTGRIVRRDSLAHNAQYSPGVSSKAVGDPAAIKL